MERSSRDSVLGASIILGLLLCALILGKVLVPLLTVVAVFVGLPAFWHFVVCRITDDTMTRAFCMLCAVALIAAISYL